MKINIEVEGKGTVEAESGARLVNALEAGGIDILHRCGGYAQCTTCRVEFVSGEPEKITEAEKSKLAEKGVAGIRLACQILCEGAMTVRAISTKTSSGLDDAGGQPEVALTPDPVWTTK